MRTVLGVTVLFIIGVAAGLMAATLSGNAGAPIDLGGRPRSPGPAEIRPAPPPVASTPTSSDVDELERAINGIPIDGVVELDHRLRGLVVTADGEPLPGVEVTARSKNVPDWARRGDPKELELERYVEQNVAYYRYCQATTRTVTSGDDGRFEILTTSGSYRLSVRHERYTFKLENGDLGEVPADAELRILAEPAGIAEIEILADPVPDSLQLFLDGPGNADTVQTWSKESPRLTLAPGLYNVRVSDQRFTGQATMALTAGEVTPVAISIQSSIIVSVLVREADGTPLETAAVHLAAGRLELVDGQLAGNPSTQSGWVQNHELARIQVPEPGTYTLVAGRSWSRMTYSTVLEIEGDLRVDVDLPAPGAADGFGFVARDPEGLFLDGVQVELSVTSPSGSSSGGTAVMPSGPGRYWVDLPSHMSSNLKESGAQLQATFTHADFGSLTQVIEPGRTDELEVRFSEPGRLAVRLVGWDTHPKRSLFTVTLHDDQDQDIAPTSPPSAGRAEFLAAPGAYELHLSCRVSSWQSAPVMVEEVTVPAGETIIDVELPELHRVAVEIDELRGKLWANLRPHIASNHYGLGQFQAPGTLFIAALADGDYELMLNGQGMGRSMTLHVNGPTTASFAAARIDALRVTVTDLQGRLARAGFQNNDLIVGIDGVEFEEQMKMQMALAACTLRERVEFMVQRSGSRLQIEVNVKELGIFSNDMGGRFRPDTRN